MTSVSKEKLVSSRRVRPISKFLNSRPGPRTPDTIDRSGTRLAGRQTGRTLAEAYYSVQMQDFNEEFDSRLRPKLEALEQVRSDLNKEGISRASPYQASWSAARSLLASHL